MKKTISSRWVFCGLIATALFACRPDDKTTLRQARLQLGAPGSIAISGHIRTSGGLPIVGSDRHPGGDRRAPACSPTPPAPAQFIGLQAGSYSVRATSSLCQFTPDVVNLNNLATSTTQDFVGSGPNCRGGGGGGGEVGGLGGHRRAQEAPAARGARARVIHSRPRTVRQSRPRGACPWTASVPSASRRPSRWARSARGTRWRIRLNNRPLIRFPDRRDRHRRARGER